MILEGKIEMNNDDTQHNLWERLKAYESKFRVIDADSTIAVTFSNSAQNRTRYFTLSLISIISALEDLISHREKFKPEYNEDNWRDNWTEYGSDIPWSTQVIDQPKTTFHLMAKIIKLTNNETNLNDDYLILDPAKLENAKAVLEQEQINLENSNKFQKTKAGVPGTEIPRNMLYYGAPGTGKSHSAKEYISGISQDHFYRVVFHADYENSDFVGSLRPRKDDKFGTVYEFEKGPFIIALEDALKNPSHPVVLLIEELNRGNAPAIFGELFQLLDREVDGSSKYEIRISETVKESLKDYEEIYSSGKISLPNNLFIIGTMNSSDQGVFPLDTAFKRRFAFEYISIDFDSHQDKPEFSMPKITIEKEKFTWGEFAKSANELMLESSIVSEDRLFGPYFLSPSELKSENLNKMICEKVLVYVWEDVLRHDDRSIIFSSALKSFGEIQKKFLLHEPVFSEKFMTQINSEKEKRKNRNSQEENSTAELENNTEVEDDNESGGNDAGQS